MLLAILHLWVLYMTVSVEQIIDAKAHIGTLKNEAHPKTQQYRADVVNGLVVIDPESIKKQLEAAREKIQAAKKEWKQVLVVSEKQMYMKDLEDLATKGWFHYLNHKVPAWFLTNFDTLQKRISTMNELRSFMESEDFESLTKKEQLTHKRKLAKTERVYKGVTGLKNMPDLVVVVDWQMMTGLIHEIEKKSIDSVVIASSNFSKFWSSSNLVITNVAGYKGIDFVLKYLLS